MREPRSTHRIQRQFHPITARTRFSPERLLTPPLLTANISFQIEPEGHTESFPRQPEETALIPKPKGQAGRPGRGGYSLKESLAWSLEFYSEMQVCPITMQTRSGAISNYYFQTFLHQLSADHLDITKILSKQDKALLDIVYVKVLTD
jgi:hypothetical protein